MTITMTARILIAFNVLLSTNSSLVSSNSSPRLTHRSLMNKSFVIFNPAARGEKSQRLRKFFESKANGSVVLAPTSGPGDAQRFAAQAVAQGCGLVIAAGGDGTVNEVVNGIGSSAVPLAVLPLGTVNVLA